MEPADSTDPGQEPNTGGAALLRTGDDAGADDPSADSSAIILAEDQAEADALRALEPVARVATMEESILAAIKNGSAIMRVIPMDDGGEPSVDLVPDKVWRISEPSSFTMVCPVERIARVCHEVNRAYCAAIGDPSQVSWERAPQWQRDSCIKGVQFALANPESTPELQHESWRGEKHEQGWKWGPVKDAEKREHPCMVAYANLPGEQKAKNAMFLAVVRAMSHRDAPVFGYDLAGGTEPA